jgi:hypothetical protein
MTNEGPGLKKSAALQIKDDLRSYLFILYFCDTLYRELETFHRWNSTYDVDNWALKSPFFNHVQQCFSRVLIIEVTKLLDDRKNNELSLFRWINRASQEATALNPKLWSGTEEVSVSVAEYRKVLIQTSLALHELDATIKTLKTHRDKYLAHNDRMYFNNSAFLIENAPLPDKEIRSSLDVIYDVLNEQSLYLFQESWAIGFRSIHSIGDVLHEIDTIRQAVADPKTSEFYFKHFQFLGRTIIPPGS